MREPDLIELFVAPLQPQGVRYLISGSVAAMLYGEPRVTHDIDLVVFLRSDDLVKLARAYPEAHFHLPPASLLLAEMARPQKGHFNVIHLDSGLKADFYLAHRDEFYAWAFRSARNYTVGAVTIALAPPEYVIVRKLEYYREGGSEKHLRDIRSMLAVSGEQLDRPVLADWIKKHGLGAEWELVSR